MFGRQTRLGVGKETELPSQKKPSESRTADVVISKELFTEAKRKNIEKELRVIAHKLSKGDDTFIVKENNYWNKPQDDMISRIGVISPETRRLIVSIEAAPIKLKRSSKQKDGYRTFARHEHPYPEEAKNELEKIVGDLQKMWLRK